MKKRVIYNETKDQKVKLAFFIFLTFHPKNANLPGNNQKRTKISPQSQTKLFTVSTLYTSINRCGANMLTIVNDAFLREINLSRWYFTVNPSTDSHDKKNMQLQTNKALFILTTKKATFQNKYLPKPKNFHYLVILNICKVWQSMYWFWWYY